MLSGFYLSILPGIFFYILVSSGIKEMSSTEAVRSDSGR